MQLEISVELKNLIPPLTDDEYLRLEQCILSEGCRDAIVIWQGIIVDGHNRYAICKKHGLDFKIAQIEFSTKQDAMVWMIDNQLSRRNLPDFCKCELVAKKKELLLAAGIEKMEEGGSKHAGNQYTDGKMEGLSIMDKPSTPKEAHNTQKAIAKDLDWSTGKVARAEVVMKKADEVTKEKLRKAEISINQAYVEIKRKTKEEEKENRRVENRAKVAMADSPEKIAEVGAKFSTIVIDPPWDWGDEGDVDQLGRARPDYATISIDKLLELPVSSLADEDCHIYLWITNRSLPKGFALLEKWGFRYITCLTWVKPYYGMGNYFRGQTEQVLFGVKGSQMLKRKDIGTVFNASRGTGGHSSKPVEFLELVEKCSHSPYLEMFSRCDRDGWFAWGEGNE